MAPAKCHMGDRRGGHWLSRRPLVGQRHRQRVRQRAGKRSKRCGDCPRALLGRRWLDRWHRCPQLPLHQDAGPRTRTSGARAELGALFPHDRRSQGGRAAVHRRRSPLPLHRRHLGHDDQDRAPLADDPRLRARHLHPNRRRARHHHDDDGLVGRGRTARQLVGAADDWVAAHGLPTYRGLLVLDLHGRLRRHPHGHPTRWLPDRLDWLCAVADPSVRRDGFVPRWFRRDWYRDDHGGIRIWRPRSSTIELPA